METLACEAAKALEASAALTRPADETKDNRVGRSQNRSHKGRRADSERTEGEGKVFSCRPNLLLDEQVDFEILNNTKANCSVVSH